MKAKRKRYDPEFKARVALEALKGVKTVQQIVSVIPQTTIQIQKAG